MPRHTAVLRKEIRFLRHTQQNIQERRTVSVLQGEERRMREFVNIDMKKDAPPRVRRHISIPEFMLSPEQRKRKREKEDLADNISLYTGVAFGLWFAWSFLCIDERPVVAWIGMGVSAVAVFLVYKWRRAHGFGGE